MNDGVHSPLPNRMMEQQHNEMSPLSPLVLAMADFGAIGSVSGTCRQKRNLALPSTTPAPSTSNACGSGSQLKSDSRPFIQRPSAQHSIGGTIVYPSEMGIEVEAGEEHLTPTYQRRGRFTVWPAAFTGNNISLPLGNRA